MAGSRREKISSLFVRVTGLLRAGALKEEDRPIWYDVMKALPPKPAPPPRDIPNILYPEDFVRVQFYRTFVEPEATVLTDEKRKSIPQRFVDKYIELQSKKVVPTEQIFSETVRIFKEEGVQLVTREENAAAERARKESLFRQQRRDIPMEGYDRTVTGDRRRQIVNLDDIFKEST